jgi:tripartite ATP-independent transporter DctP family solute receptor
MSYPRRPPLARRSLLAAGVALPLVAIRTRPAGAAEFTYKYANNVPLTHPMNVRAQEAANRIKEKTGGRVEIQLFPNNQLGSDTDTLSQLRAGAVEFFTLSGLILSTLVPVASINGIGFAFKDYGQVWPAMDGALGAHVRTEIAKRGLYAMAKQWDNGYRQITSAAKPIRTPEDLNGFKIRVPPSPLWTSMFEAFGAAPTSINFNETYSALQTHLVDGQENPLAIIDVAKLYEVQKYLSVTNHMWDGWWFLANRRAWDALPEDARGIVETELNASALQEREDIAHLDATLQGSLKGHGMEFLNVDPMAFRAALKKAGFYGEWRDKYGAEAWGLLEAAVGGLA